MVDRPFFWANNCFTVGLFSVHLKRVEKILWPTQPTATHPILANRKIETSIYVCKKVVLEPLPFFFCYKYGVSSGTVSWKQKIVDWHMFYWFDHRPLHPNPSVVVAGDHHLNPITVDVFWCAWICVWWLFNLPPEKVPPRKNCFIRKY